VTFGASCTHGDVLAQVAESRYSIPFFSNAASDYPMECLATCQGPGNPPKYPTISYGYSQATAQGE
jgi:isopenicillin N synthase-like dioxygenase